MLNFHFNQINPTKKRWNPNGGETFAAYNDGILYAEAGKSRQLKQKMRNTIEFYRKQKIRLLKIRPNCSYCNTPLTYKTATIDHIIPIYDGGTDKKSNLCLACKQCNRDKGHKRMRFSEVYSEVNKNVQKRLKQEGLRYKKDITQSDTKTLN